MIACASTAENVWTAFGVFLGAGIVFLGYEIGRRS